jgi:hypothetical protein
LIEITPSGELREEESANIEAIPQAWPTGPLCWSPLNQASESQTSNAIL